MSAGTAPLGERQPVSLATIDQQQIEQSTDEIYSKQYLSGLRSHLDLVNALTLLEANEVRIDESLSKSLESTQRLQVPLSRIEQLKPVVLDLTHDALALHEVVVERASVAERISSKVRVLDLEQARVKDCIDRVLSATELRDALGQLYQSIDRADWEAATRHIQRANAIDKDFLTSRFSEAVVPTADIPDPPAVALENFTTQLTDIFLKSFETAARSKDEATTTRFFKLFPLLGTAASETGLRAYSDFVRTLISVPASITRPADGTRGTSIVAQFTSIFEQLALIIDQHQVMVDKYYGPRSMVKVVIRLNEEMDRLISKFVSSWESDRQVDRMLSGVSRSSFPWLTQTLNNTTTSAQSSNLVTPSGIPSLRTLAGNVQRTYSLHPSGSNLPNAPSSASTEEERHDPRDIDLLVAELAGMSARWQTYRRFLHSRFSVEEAVDPESDNHKPDEEKSPTLESVPRFSEQTRKMENPEVHRTLQNLLNRLYLPLETWYLRVNIEKAHMSDEMDLNSPPYLSSALDDTFYMIKKVTLRLITLGDQECVQSGLVMVRELVERDFGEVIHRRLESVAANMSSGTVGFGSGMKVGDEKEKKERMTRSSYIVYLNNLDMASEYIARLVEEAITGPALSHAFFIPNELEPVKTYLEDLKKSEKKFGAIVKGGLEQLFNQLIRPRIRSILSDCYKDVSYVLDDESFAEAEYQDLFRKRFFKAWESLMEPYRSALTSKNYHDFFSMTVHVLVRPWEMMIKNMKFNELGAMRFDKDLRLVTSYLSNQTGFGISLVNENFTRLRQMSMLLGLDESEEDLKDFLVSEEISWRLTMTEIKGVLGQKI